MKMKNLLLVLQAITLVFSMTVVGCDKDSTDDTQKVKFESADAAGNMYILAITGNTSRAAYKGAEGDSYVLTIKQQGQPDKESKGVVTTIAADGALTLKPTKADSVPFGVSVSSGKMTAITGTITLEDGEEVPAPETLMPVDGIFTSMASMAAWLRAQPQNTADTPYGVKLNANLAGSTDLALLANNTKYFSLNLSSSTGITFLHTDHFHGLTTLISITIPASVTYMDGHTFNTCSMLVSIEVDPGNTEYASVDGILVTKDMSALISYPPAKANIVTIPNGITTIGGSAFQANTKITSVTIPDSVTSIGGSFSSCFNLTSVTIGNGVTNIGKDAFSDCTSLASITIPDSVTNIGKYAFYGCTSLASITIPDSVTSIEDSAFYGCTSLTSVTFEGTITSANFGSYDPFPGNLRTKYLASDGGIGTYTTTAPVGNKSVWTKQ